MQTSRARRRATMTVISAAAVGALITGCTSTGTIGEPQPGVTKSSGAKTDGKSSYAAVDDFYKQSVKWGVCKTPPPEAPDTDLSAFQCGTFDVPLDYAKPSG